MSSTLQERLRQRQQAKERARRQAATSTQQQQQQQQLASILQPQQPQQPQPQQSQQAQALSTPQPSQAQGSGTPQPLHVPPTTPSATSSVSTQSAPTSPTGEFAGITNNPEHARVLRELEIPDEFFRDANEFNPFKYWDTQSARLEEYSARVDEAIDDQLPDSHQGFNTATLLFSEILQRFTHSQESVSKLTSNLTKAQRCLSSTEGRQTMLKLYFEHERDKKVLEILRSVQRLQAIPAQLDSLIEGKQYVECVRLLQQTIADLFGPDLQDLSVLADLRETLLARRNELQETLIQELVDCLHLRAKPTSTVEDLITEVIKALRIGGRVPSAEKSLHERTIVELRSLIARESEAFFQHLVSSGSAVGATIAPSVSPFLNHSPTPVPLAATPSAASSSSSSPTSTRTVLAATAALAAPLSALPFAGHSSAQIMSQWCGYVLPRALLVLWYYRYLFEEIHEQPHEPIDIEEWDPTLDYAPSRLSMSTSTESLQARPDQFSLGYVWGTLQAELQIILGKFLGHVEDKTSMTRRRRGGPRDDDESPSVSFSFAASATTSVVKAGRRAARSAHHTTAAVAAAVSAAEADAEASLEALAALRSTRATETPSGAAHDDVISPSPYLIVAVNGAVNRFIGKATYDLFPAGRSPPRILRHYLDQHIDDTLLPRLRLDATTRVQRLLDGASNWRPVQVPDYNAVSSARAGSDTLGPCVFSVYHGAVDLVDYISTLFADMHRLPEAVDSLLGVLEQKVVTRFVNEYQMRLDNLGASGSAGANSMSPTARKHFHPTRQSRTASTTAHTGPLTLFSLSTLLADASVVAALRRSPAYRAFREHNPEHAADADPAEIEAQLRDALHPLLSGSVSLRRPTQLLFDYRQLQSLALISQSLEWVADHITAFAAPEPVAASVESHLKPPDAGKHVMSPVLTSPEASPAMGRDSGYHSVLARKRYAHARAEASDDSKKHRRGTSSSGGHSFASGSGVLGALSAGDLQSHTAQVGTLNALRIPFNEWRDPEATRKVELAAQRMASKCRDLADRTLFALRLELQCHCFFFLTQMEHSTYCLRDNPTQPDSFVIDLNKDLTRLQGDLEQLLPAAKMQFLFEGLPHLVTTILKLTLPKLADPRINSRGIMQLHRNCYALQQNITNLVDHKQDQLFDRARQYFSLVSMPEKERLQFRASHSEMFTDEEYRALSQVHLEPDEEDPES